MESAPTALGTVVQTFKRYTTVEYIKRVKQNILPPFKQRIWQRNYWERVIRDENEYSSIAQYIIDNPKKWDLDKLNYGSANLIMESSAQYQCNAPSDKTTGENPAKICALSDSQTSQRY